MGASLTEVSGFDSERSFRFELDGHVVDVLAADGLAAPPRTAGRLQTIQIPGGSQALARMEPVAVAGVGRRGLSGRQAGAGPPSSR